MFKYKNQIKITYTLLTFLAFIILACSSINEQIGTEYNFDSGLKIKVIKLGNGSKAKKGDRLTIHYIMKSQDGTEIENTRKANMPVKFILGAGELIKGIDLVCDNMIEGSIRQVIVPTALAFYDEKYSRESKHDDIFLEIELVEVE